MDRFCLLTSAFNFLNMNSIILMKLLLIILLDHTKSENPVKVRVKNGLIYGRRGSFVGREYNQFLGIPYAEPPVGPLRFKKPVLKKESIEPFHANQWPNSCMHNRYNEAEHYFSDRMSEDCLYLNIWSPITPEFSDTLKPVMFFIHGGGIYFGSSSENMYSGHVLALKGEVVVVTINYRLNTFGLLYTGTDDAPGNMALWDQALALEWVNDNIKYFGGDPNRITLFGESAGAWSTSLHILSPVSRNLFQNAIIMSGATINNMTICDHQTVLNIWIKRVEEAGCVDEENTDQTNKKFTSKMFECLNKLSVHDLIDMSSLSFGYCFTPLTIDNTFIVDRPINLIRSGEFKKNFSLMVGTTEDEGSFMLAKYIDQIKYNKHNPEAINYEQANADLAQIFNERFGIDGEEVAKVYFTGISDNNSGDQLRHTMGIAIGDFFLACPTISFAKLIYSNDPESTIFQYLYNSKEGDPNKLFCSHWMGVCHYNDIYPVFGVPFYDSDRYVDKERQVSDKMIDIFASFAKSGHPSAQESAEWQSFYKIDNNIIAPFYEITSEPKPNSNFGISLKINECEYLWNKYII